jgi:hypothetical protein
MYNTPSASGLSACRVFLATTVVWLCRLPLSHAASQGKLEVGHDGPFEALVLHNVCSKAQTFTEDTPHSCQDLLFKVELKGKTLPASPLTWGAVATRVSSENSTCIHTKAAEAKAHAPSDAAIAL